MKKTILIFKLKFQLAITLAATFLILFICISVNAEEIVEFKKSHALEFNPIQGQNFKITFNTKTKSFVSIAIYTPDDDLLRIIKTTEELSVGEHNIEWDGKDEDGIIVPDEAYIPVLTAYTADKKIVILDPRKIGGGEIIDDINIAITPDKNIEYYLPETARVLIRVGIKNGPMYRSLANWIPKTAGKNIQLWDGYDNDNLIDLRNDERLGVLVTAFKLPPYVIITFGNNKLNYRQYRKEKKWQNKILKQEDMLLVKNNTRISPHYYYSREDDTDPVVILQLQENLPLSTKILNQSDVTSPSDDKDVLHKDNMLTTINDSVKIKVDIPEKDRWSVQKSLYEITFYVDNEFISEEEQGYVPLTWIWKPVGLAKGKHILTVNVSGFRGQVGVKSLFFQVNNDRL